MTLAPNKLQITTVKIFSKLYRKGELNFLANFNLILSVKVRLIKVKVN